MNEACLSRSAVIAYALSIKSELDYLYNCGNMDISELDWRVLMEKILRVNDIPVAETVQVVRCRDCRHRFVDGEGVRYNCCELNHEKAMPDDWFCADGERKNRRD